MSPQPDRSAPLYVQVADHYRRQIVDGELAEGAKLPIVTEIADAWKVAPGTVSRAMSQLQVEGLVTTTARGTFVQARHRSASAPHDRLSRVRRGDALTAVTEVEHVNVAEMVTAPLYVAELLDVEPGSHVIRREWVSIRERQLHMLSVSWFRPELAGTVPELLEARPIHQGGAVARIEQATGRRVTEARDYYEAREADTREANAIGTRVGSPILAGTYIWGDETGVIEYGEFVLPAKRVISYSYEIEQGE